MPAPRYDYLIIGQGIAGSILAYRLIKRGQKVLVIDNSHASSSSMVAAGIINPITGHRLNITAGFDKYWPIAKSTYTEMEQEFGAQFFTQVEQHRLIKNKGQFDYLQQRVKQEEYVALLGNRQRESSHFIANEYGSIDIKHSAIVDCKTLLTSCKNWLQESDSYLETKFNYAVLNSHKSGFEYEQLSANKLVFCEGYTATENPWLSELPFKLAKGEILTVQLSDDHAFELPLLNWGNWLAPSAKRGMAKLGASFEWEDLSLQPNPNTARKLLASLRSHTKIRGDIIAAEVGVRPTTRDRIPFVGALNALEGAHCFNGFGSKGCLLIPYYSNLLADHLIDQTALPDELTRWL